MILKTLTNTIFSQVLEAGPSRCVSPVGRMISQYGPVPVHASLSARQAKALGLLTTGTYGQRGIGSFNSDGPLSFLANKSQTQLNTDGSTQYKVIWQELTTPSGLRLWSQQVKAPPIFEAACTLWPTPTARDWISESATDKFNAKRWASKAGKPLAAIARLMDPNGKMRNGFPVLTGKSALLNPEFCRWLMGYPREWGLSGATAMQLCRKSRRRLLNHT